MVREQNYRPKIRIIADDEQEATGFDSLWDTSLEEAKQFINKKKVLSQVQKTQEHKLYKKELEAKNFEIQKLSWQLKEREKELKKLYEEVEDILGMNKKLNKQLEDYYALLELVRSEQVN